MFIPCVACVSFKSDLCSHFVMRSGHEGGPILVPGFAIIWKQNQVTRQVRRRDLAQLVW